MSRAAGEYVSVHSQADTETAVLVPAQGLILAVSGSSLAFLALLGAIAAGIGGARVLAGAWRVTFWGALAMAITAGVGSLFGSLLTAR